MIGVDVQIKRVNSGCFIPKDEFQDEPSTNGCDYTGTNLPDEYVKNLINRDGFIYAGEWHFGSRHDKEEKSPEALIDLFRKSKKYEKALELCRKNLVTRDQGLMKRILLKMALIYRACKDEAAEFNARAAFYTLAPRNATNRQRIQILMSKFSESKNIPLPAA